MRVHGIMPSRLSRGPGCDSLGTRIRDHGSDGGIKQSNPVRWLLSAGAAWAPWFLARRAGTRARWARTCRFGHGLSKVACAIASPARQSRSS